MSLCARCGSSKCCCRNDSQRVQHAPGYRKTAHRRGYDHRWRAARLAYLARAENRLCKICNAALSQCIDHIIDHHGDPKLFWDTGNWQPACIACNTRKAQKK